MDRFGPQMPSGLSGRQIRADDGIFLCFGRRKAAIGLRLILEEARVAGAARPGAIGREIDHVAIEEIVRGQNAGPEGAGHQTASRRTPKPASGFRMASRGRMPSISITGPTGNCDVAQCASGSPSSVVATIRLSWREAFSTMVTGVDGAAPRISRRPRRKAAARLPM